MIGRLLIFFVPALLLSILPPLFFPSSSVSLSYFILAVPMRECFWKTLVHEFPISYSHTKWYLHFWEGKSPCFGRSFAYQNLIILLLWKSMYTLELKQEYSFSSTVVEVASFMAMTVLERHFSNRYVMDILTDIHNKQCRNSFQKIPQLDLMVSCLDRIWIFKF